MSVTKKDTEYAAGLARLGLTEDEKGLFTGQLNNILGYIDIINSVDTKTVLPAVFYGPGGAEDFITPMREDKAVPFKDTGNILAAAPMLEDNMFRVPKILETEE